MLVNGNNVLATGLFVEHYQKFEVIWNGQHGKTIFFQNEMPYDVPDQASWISAPGINGFNWWAHASYGGCVSTRHRREAWASPRRLGV